MSKPASASASASASSAAAVAAAAVDVDGALASSLRSASLSSSPALAAAAWTPAAPTNAPGGTASAASAAPSTTPLRQTMQTAVGESLWMEKVRFQLRPGEKLSGRERMRLAGKFADALVRVRPALVSNRVVMGMLRSTVFCQVDAADGLPETPFDLEVTVGSAGYALVLSQLSARHLRRLAQAIPAMEDSTPQHWETHGNGIMNLLPAVTPQIVEDTAQTLITGAIFGMAEASSIYMYSIPDDEVVVVREGFVYDPEMLKRLKILDKPLPSGGTSILACFFCRRSGLDPTVELKACARCRCVAYCTVHCQTNDWNMFHRAECRTIAAGGPEGAKVAQSLLFCRVVTENQKAQSAEAPLWRGVPPHPYSKYIVTMLGSIDLRTNMPSGHPRGHRIRGHNNSTPIPVPLPNPTAGKGVS